MQAAAQSDKRDFVLINGRIQTVSDLDAALAIIDNTVRSQKGEYRYNTPKGVDYTGNVFGPTPNYQLFESQVRAQVSSLSFVESIDSFTYNVTDNTLFYEMTVKTIYGTETIDNG